MAKNHLREDESHVSRMTSFHKKSLLVPVWNYFYTIFFSHEAPTFEETVALCNFIGLVSALLFSVCASIPLSINKEEVSKNDLYHYKGTLEQRELYGLNNPTTGVYTGKAGCIIWDIDSWNDHDSVRMLGTMTTGFFLLALSLMSSVVVAMSITSLSIEEAEWAERYHPEKGQYRSVETGKGITTASLQSYERAKKWWSSGKFPVFFSAVTCILGTGYTFFAMHEISFLKFPNYYFEDLCEDAGWVFSHLDPEFGVGMYTNGSYVKAPSFHARFRNNNDDPTVTGYFLNFWLVGLTTVVVIWVGYSTGLSLLRAEKRVKDIVNLSNESDANDCKGRKKPMPTPGKQSEAEVVKLNNMTPC